MKTAVLLPANYDFWWTITMLVFAVAIIIGIVAIARALWRSRSRDQEIDQLKRDVSDLRERGDHGDGATGV
jgi:hypothetical protein